MMEMMTLEEISKKLSSLAKLRSSASDALLKIFK